MVHTALARTSAPAAKPPCSRVPLNSTPARCSHSQFPNVKSFHQCLLCLAQEENMQHEDVFYLISAYFTVSRKLAVRTCIYWTALLQSSLFQGLFPAQWQYRYFMATIWPSSEKTKDILSLIRWGIWLKDRMILFAYLSYKKEKSIKILRLLTCVVITVPLFCFMQRKVSVNGAGYLFKTLFLIPPIKWYRSNNLFQALSHC